MDGLGVEIDGPLFVIRALHFAVTAMTTGVLIFREIAVDRALCLLTPAGPRVRGQLLRLARICLALSVASGMIWLMLVAAAMSGLSLEDAVTPEVLLAVLNQTQFGRVAEIRLALVIILAGCLGYDRAPSARWLGFAMSVGLTAAIAWTGHAGSTAGSMGIVHLAADTLHLGAAAIWIGGLVSLVVLLSASMQDRTVASASFASEATRRFSTLGVAAVLAIFVTGFVNAWILVGSLHALTATGYGELLLLKIALFIAMLSVAAVNRFWWTPRLALPSSPATGGDARRRLARNSVIEIALALMIFAIVGVLGTLHPAIHGVAPHTSIQ
jgi:putative copper resistance protein D